MSVEAKVAPPLRPVAVRSRPHPLALGHGARTALVLAVLIGAIGPTFVGSAWLSAWTTCAIFVIVAAGTGVLYGWLALTSLTQVALAGVGGWVALRLGIGTDLPFLLVVLIAGAVTGAVGLVLTLPALRVRGLRLALVTLMIAGGFSVVFNATGFPNGGRGFLGYQMTGDLERLARPGFAASDVAYFRLVLLVAATVLIVVQLQLRGRAGRAWALLAESEAAAASAGVSLVRTQMWAFTLAASLAGVGGALLAGQVGQLTPSTFQVSESMLLFALVVVAGAHHWVGWLLAAALYQLVPFALSESHVNGSAAMVIFGVALMVNMLGSPRGAVGQVQELAATWRARRQVST